MEANSNNQHIAGNGWPGWGVSAANPSVVDTPPTPKAEVSSRMRLNTIADVKREYRRLYVEARKGTITTGDASKLGYLLQALANLIADSDLEARLDALESPQGRK